MLFGPKAIVSFMTHNQIYDEMYICFVLQGLHTTLGTPTTLQIGARPFNESTLIEIAYAYEQLTMHRAPPQLFPECTNPTVSTGTTSTSATATAG